MKRKWLKALMLMMMAGASFGGPMNPKEIEDLMYIMSQTRIEWTVTDDNDNGDGGKTGTHHETMNHLLEHETQKQESQ